MKTSTQVVLVRHTDGTPALWLDIVDIELLHEDGRRSHDYTGTMLNDDRISIPFDPSQENLEIVVEEWKRATA